MLQLKSLTLSELAQHASLWDDLWQRSSTQLPFIRFEGIKLWCQVFAPTDEFIAIIVESDGRFVAGLPFIRDNKRWPLTVYRLTSNCTVGAGDLLIDPDCEIEAVTQAIARQLTKLPGTIAALEGISIHSERWQRLIGALQKEGRELHVSPGHDVGVVDILHDWDAYTRSWSRNHRSAIKRSRNKLESEGEVKVERIRHPSDDELYEALELCFAIENKGWKGENGTSILGTPGLREYYHQEAKIMRDLGMLDLWLLKLNDQIIAFEYCHYSKNVCFSHKISFDPEFERLSPGKVLRCIQLEQYHQDPLAEQLDTLGVLCEAKAKWVTRSYKSSRCFVAIGGFRSNLLLRLFKTVRRAAKRLRRANSETCEIKPGSKKYFELANHPKKPVLAPLTLANLPDVFPAEVTSSPRSHS